MPSHRFPAPAPRRGKNADSSREPATPETSGNNNHRKEQDFSRSADKKTPRRDGRTAGKDADRKPRRQNSAPNGGRGNAGRKPGHTRREDEFPSGKTGTETRPNAGSENETGFTSAFARPSRPEAAPHEGPRQAPEASHEIRDEIRNKAGQEEAPHEEGFLQPGIKPVTELLQNNPEKIDTVFLLKGRKGKETSLILDLCREHGVRFSLMDETGLARLWRGRHQGVIARLFATGFTDLQDLLALAPDAPLPLIVALDQVQDPGNAGALARTLYALGGAGLLVPRHNGVYLGAGAARVAAGALDKLPVAKAANLAQALDAALDAGYAVYGAEAMPDQSTVPAQSVYGFTPDLPAVLVLGSEEDGLRPIIRKRCTAFLSIPFAREFDSLNVAQAGAIIISAFAAARPPSK